MQTILSQIYAVDIEAIEGGVWQTSERRFGEMLGLASSTITIIGKKNKNNSTWAQEKQSKFFLHSKKV